jgi:hypothetical protein
MTISGSEIARNGSEVENIIFDLLKKLQTSSNNNFPIIGDDEYRKVEGGGFEIYFTEGVISLTVNSATIVSSDNKYLIETVENQYNSKLVENFFLKLKELLLSAKHISAHNVGFMEAK